MGVLHYTPTIAGRTRLGHLFAAMQAHYHNAKIDKMYYANLLRRHVTELVNIQLKPSDRVTPEQLWKFAWDNEKEKIFVSEEKAQKQLEFLERAMKKAFENGK